MRTGYKILWSMFFLVLAYLCWNTDHSARKQNFRQPGVYAESLDSNPYRFSSEHRLFGLRTMMLTRESDNVKVVAIVSPQDLDLHQLGMQDHVRLVWLRYQITPTQWSSIPVLTAW